MQSAANRAPGEERQSDSLRGEPEGQDGTDGPAAKGGGKLEVSGTQVAAGAAATMIAAFLASSLGVYGTIIGAGVVSVGATAGGAIFQHVFRRTGQQIKEVAVTAPKALSKQPTHLGPAVRNDTSTSAATSTATGTATAAAAPEERDETAVLPEAAARPLDERQLIKVPADLTGAQPPSGGYTSASTYGTRMRGGRRIAVVAAGTFLAVMAVIVGIEQLTGGSMASWWGNDGKGGNTISDVFGGKKSADAPADEDHGPDGDAPDDGTTPGEKHGGTAETPDDDATGDQPDKSDDDSHRPAPGTGDDDAEPTPEPEETDPGSGTEDRSPQPTTGEESAVPRNAAPSETP